MNKVLKIIIKKDPIFKYIVEDYPFYEGIFFNSKDFHIMNILNCHCLLRRKLPINQGETEIFCNPKYLMGLISKFRVASSKLLINPKFRIKSRVKFCALSMQKVYTRFNLRLKMSDKNYSKGTVKLYMMKLIRLKTHDPYTLENRDMLTLAKMDGEKIL